MSAILQYYIIHMILSQLPKTYTFSIRLFALIIGFSLFVTTAVQAVVISINGSEDLNVQGDIVYDYNSSPKTMSLQISSPFLCSNTGVSTQTIQLFLNDSGNFPINDPTGSNGVLSAIYDVATGRVLLNTDFTLLCSGLLGTYSDVIYNAGFELLENDLELNLFNKNGDVFDANAVISAQPEFGYQYVLTNNSAVLQIADVLENYNADVSKPYFTGVAGDDWTCAAYQADGVTLSVNSSCGDFVAGDDTVSLKNASIAPLEILIVDVKREVIVPNGTIGTNLELFAAAFATSHHDVDDSNNSVFKQFVTADNIPATITVIANQTIDEDSATGNIEFTIGDVETDIVDLVVTSSSSDNQIVSAPGIVVTDTADPAIKNVVVTPEPNANGTVTITITVSDGITTTDESFDLVITPVNDKPTFSLATIADIASGTSGTQPVIEGFLTVTSFGAPDESSQSIIATNLVVTSDPNGIISGTPQLTNTGGSLFYLLTGNGGTATIEVSIQDDGGLANSGDDTSITQTFTITVLNNAPTITAIADISFNEDDDSSVIAVSVSDVETNDGTLVVTASSSNQSVIADSGIQITGATGARSIVISPVVNQNTVDSGVVTITVTVDDGSDTSQMQFDVTINPINDAPEFGLMGDITKAVADAGPLIEVINFATLTNLGPTPDEDTSQNIVAYTLNITAGASIFDEAIVPVSINTNGTLKYILSGTTGTATIEVTLQDDGGTANGGVDSTTHTFTVTVN